jgi:hypothetical protein
MTYLQNTFLQTGNEIGKGQKSEYSNTENSFINETSNSMC